MRMLALSALVSISAIGCIESEGAKTKTVTIRGTPASAVELVAVRNGPHASWQPAAKTAPGEYTATVSHPYTIAVVCHFQPRTGPDVWHTYEYGFSLDDSDPGFACAELDAAPTQPVFGTMVQAGQVQFGESSARSETPNWQISMLVVPAIDLSVIASSKDHVQILRHVDTTAIDAAHPMPPIDVDANGAALVPIQVTSNATANETVAVHVVARTPYSGLDPSTAIYTGPLDTALAAPGAVLAADDEQIVAVEAIAGTQHRIGKVNFVPAAAGDRVAVTLPAPIVNPVWTPLATAAAAKPPAPAEPTTVTWSGFADSDTDFVELRIDGAASDPASPTTTATYDLLVTPKYMTDAVYDSLDLDTQLPGYDARWRVDPTKPYTRTLSARPGGQLHPSEVSLHETITPGAT